MRAQKYANILKKANNLLFFCNYSPFWFAFVLFKYANKMPALRFVLSRYTNKTSVLHFVLFRYTNKTFPVCL